MAHRLAPEAEMDLDGIWYYVAKESDSMEIADRLIDSITARFSCSPRTLISVVNGTRTYDPVCEVSQWVSLSSFIAPRTKMSSFFAWCAAAGIFRRCCIIEVTKSIGPLASE